MLTEYKCSLCNLKLNADVEKQFKCHSCGTELDLIFKKVWKDSVQDGAYDVFQLDDGKKHRQK